MYSVYKFSTGIVHSSFSYYMLALRNTPQKKTNETASIEFEYMDKVNRHFVKIYMFSTFINFQAITMIYGCQSLHIGFRKSIS